MAETRLDVILALRDKFSAGVRVAQNRLQGFNTRMKTTSASADAMAASFRRIRNVLIGVGIIKGLKDTVDAAIDFESAFAGVRKTVDATEKEFQQLSDRLLDLSREIPVAATDLARIQELAGQLGVSGVDNLTKFTDTVAKISVTTNLTAESAATDFARIANIMQTPIDEVDRMASSVVDLGNNFATTESEIVNFANRIAGAGRVVGLSEADILAFGTAFSSVGVEAERGGTAVNKALIQIGRAVTNGGRDLNRFARIAGVTSAEFARSFREDAGRAFALFIEGLGKSGLEGARVLEELQLSDQRLVQSFLSVGGASGILTRAIDRASIAYEENIALNVEASKRFDTTAAKIQLMKNNITVLQIQIGNRLLPVFEKLLRVTKQYVDFATGLDIELKNQAPLVDRLKDAYKGMREELEELKRLQGQFGQGFLDAIGDPAELNRKIAITERQLAVLAGKIARLNQTPVISPQTFDESKAKMDQFNRSVQQTLDGIGRASVSSEDAIETAAREIAQKTKVPFEQVVQDITGSAQAMSEAIQAGIAEPLSGIIDGTKTASEAFSEMGKNLLGFIADYIAKTIVAFTIGRAIQAIATKLAIAQATILANAWAPAAFFAAVATGGVAAEAGAAALGVGLASVGALATGLIQKAVGPGGAEVGVQSFATGGVVRGQEGQVPIIAHAGEGILSRQGMAALGGESNLDRLNKGQQVSGGSTNISVNVYYPKMSKKEEVKELSFALGQEIRNQLLYART